MKKIHILLVSLLTLVACNNVEDKGMQDLNASLEQQKVLSKGIEFDLRVDATYEQAEPKGAENLRALTFNPEALGGKIQAHIPTKKVKVLCLFRSDDASDPITYRELEFDRVGDENSNRLKVKTVVTLDPSVTVAEGKKWYCLGIIGGQFDEQTKKLSFKSSASKPLASGELGSVDVPAISEWLELPAMKKDKDGIHRSQYPLDETSAEYKKFTYTTFYTQGMLFRYKIDTNASDYDMEINGLTLVSTAMSFDVDYDLSLAGLSSVTTTANARRTNLVNYSLKSENQKSTFFPVSNKGLKEYQTKLDLPQPLNISAKATNDKYILFWGMPTELADSYTAIYLDTKVAGGGDKLLDVQKDLNYMSFDDTGYTGLKTKTATNHLQKLPVYYCNHKAQFENGKTCTLRTAEILRPKLPIEYMAHYNMKSKQSYEFLASPPTGHPWVNIWWQPEGDNYSRELPNKMDNRHSITSTTDCIYVKTFQINYPDYHIPSLKEWASVLPFKGNYGSLNATIIRLREESRLNNVEVPIEVEGVKTTMSVDAHNTGNELSYTMHYSKTSQAKDLMLACRIRTVPNPNPDIKKINLYWWMRMRQLVDFGDSKRYRVQYNNSMKNSGTKLYFEIQVRYLNPRFTNIASFSDVTTDEFWANNNEDDVIRYLTPTYMFLQGVSQGGGIDASWPHSILMAASDKPTDLSQKQPYNTFLISGGNRRIGSHFREGVTTTSVRLFSDK